MFLNLLKLMGTWYLKRIQNTIKVRVSYRNQRRNAVEEK